MQGSPMIPPRPPVRPVRCRCRQRFCWLDLVWDRRGRPRVARQCRNCGGRAGSAPLPARPRRGLLGLLLALDEVGVAWSRTRQRGLRFRPCLPAALLGDVWHHAPRLAAMATPGSAPGPC